MGVVCDSPLLYTQGDEEPPGENAAGLSEGPGRPHGKIVVVLRTKGTWVLPACDASGPRRVFCVFVATYVWRPWVHPCEGEREEMCRSAPTLPLCVLQHELC